MSRQDPPKEAAMKFVKELAFTVPSAPPGKGIIVLRDAAGWYYLWWHYKQEGPTAPFFSIEELEWALGEKLTLVYERPIPEQEET